MIKLTDAAKLLGVHPRTVLGWVRDKTISFFRLDPDWTIYVPREQVESLKAEVGSPPPHGDALDLEAMADPYMGIVMDDFELALKFLQGDGWSYGLIRFLDPMTGEEVCQIDAHKGGRREKGAGRTWLEATKDLMQAIFGAPTPTFH